MPSLEVRPNRLRQQVETLAHDADSAAEGLLRFNERFGVRVDAAASALVDAGGAPLLEAFNDAARKVDDAVIALKSVAKQASGGGHDVE